LTKDEALKLALDVLVYASSYCDTYDAIEAVKEALAQPGPDDLTIAYMSGVYDGKKQAQSSPQPDERNFCPRCGKRRGGDVNYIHTCTPPQETK
jgi:hypothetical protein